MSAPDQPDRDTLYARLAAPFEDLQQDSRSGITFEYATGEQVTRRLLDVLGPLGWSWRIVEHGIDEAADEVWVLGELVVDYDGRSVMRQQFGSQKLKRSRASGTALDVGFDLKGAATDALKKCATLYGVALYLSAKETNARTAAHAQAAAERKRPAGDRGAKSDGASAGSAPTPAGGRPAALSCADCQKTLGTAVAAATARQFGRPLCSDHAAAAAGLGAA